MKLNEALNSCLCNMKASLDFNDDATIASIQELLSCIIEDPSQVINYPDEERLSIALASIMTSQYPNEYGYYKNVNIKNLVFACGYYLFMHQLEKGRFIDRNWPAFLTLLHIGRRVFANFIVGIIPYASEAVKYSFTAYREEQSPIDAARGIELNMMAAAQKKGFLTDDLIDWYYQLLPGKHELLEPNPFVKIAIPLYHTIAEILKSGNIDFANSI